MKNLLIKTFNSYPSLNSIYFKKTKNLIFIFTFIFINIQFSSFNYVYAKDDKCVKLRAYLRSPVDNMCNADYFQEQVWETIGYLSVDKNVHKYDGIWQIISDEFVEFNNNKSVDSFQYYNCENKNRTTYYNMICECESDQISTVRKCQGEGDLIKISSSIVKGPLDIGVFSGDILFFQSEFFNDQDGFGKIKLPQIEHMIAKKNAKLIACNAGVISDDHSWFLEGYISNNEINVTLNGVTLSGPIYCYQTKKQEYEGIVNKLNIIINKLNQELIGRTRQVDIDRYNIVEIKHYKIINVKAINIPLEHENTLNCVFSSLYKIIISEIDQDKKINETVIGYFDGEIYYDAKDFMHTFLFKEPKTPKEQLEMAAEIAMIVEPFIPYKRIITCAKRMKIAKKMRSNYMLPSNYRKFANSAAAAKKTAKNVGEKKNIQQNQDRKNSDSLFKNNLPDVVLDDAISMIDDIENIAKIGKLKQEKAIKMHIDEMSPVSTGGTWNNPDNKQFLESFTNSATKGSRIDTKPTVRRPTLSLADAARHGPDAFRDAAMDMLSRPFSEVRELRSITCTASRAMKNTIGSERELANRINKSIRNRIIRGATPEARLVRDALEAVGIKFFTAVP